MFTGIIEAQGVVRRVERTQDNVHFTIESPISGELRIDQSVSHDGVCLTVTALEAGAHKVTAIAETIRRSNLGDWQVGRRVNLERSMSLGARLDGHMVQGHVDTTAEVLDIAEEGGSWLFTFRYEPSPERILVDKGSICVNGISLTVVAPSDEQFRVAIIPYTWEHTNLSQLRQGDRVNLEFDVIGKYIARHIQAYLKSMAS